MDFDEEANAKINKQLMDCVSSRYCDSNEVRMLIKKGAWGRCFGEKKYENTNALCLAINNNLSEQIVSQLVNDVSLSVDIDKVIGGATALLLSIDKENYQLFTLLIDSGADISRECNDCNPLMKSVEIRDILFLETLIRRGTDVNARPNEQSNHFFPKDYNPSKRYMSPLIWAARNNSDPSFCSLLIKHGADVNYKCNCSFKGSSGTDIVSRDMFEDWTALMSAAEINPNPEVCSVLIDAGAEIDAVSSWGSALCLAVDRNPNAMVAKRLIGAGADVNEVARQRTLLMRAAERRVNPIFCSILLQAGADVNATNDKGHTALHGAARNANPTVCQLLIDAGANINATSDTGETDSHDEHCGNTALHAAAENSNPKVCQLLIDAGADVNAVTSIGMTPIMSAVFCNTNEKVCEVLINAGAKINQPGGYSLKRPSTGGWRGKRVEGSGWSPLALAAAFNPNPKVCQLLIDAGADVNYTNEGFVIDFDSYGPEEKCYEFGGQTPLHYSMGNSPDICSLLIRYGADVNAFDAFGMTPLMDAARSGDDKLSRCESLVQAGAQIDLPAKTIKPIIHPEEFRSNLDHRNEISGQSAFMFALRCPIFSEEIVSFFINNGANVNLRDNYGNTPLIHLVSSYKSSVPKDRHPSGKEVECASCESLVQLLLDAGADPNGQNLEGQTAIWSAIIEGEMKTFLLLSSNGGNIDSKNKDGKTPLVYACSDLECRDLKTLILVIESGANLNSTDAEGKTPLMHAILSITKLDCLIDVYMRDMDEHKTEVVGDIQCLISKLLDSGACTDIRDVDGNTALDYADKKQSPALRGGISMEIFKKTDGYRKLQGAE